MKKIFLTLIFAMFISITTQAQISHDIDGKTYELTEVITGKVSFFYKIINGEYQYFVKKNNKITELINTREENGKYREEYKETLSNVTVDAPLDISNVELTLDSLTLFFDEYNNKTIDQNYSKPAKISKPENRFGFFGGISNNPFVDNPENIIVPIFGAECDVGATESRHSLAFGLKASFSGGDDFDYTSGQFSFAYRFKIIHKESFTLYPQATLVTYTYASSEVTVVDPETSISTTTSISGESFDTPIILGIGADIKLGIGYITISANELVALIDFKNQGNFPVDLRLGYKLNIIPTKKD